MYHIDVSQMHFQTNQRGDPFDVSTVLYKQHFRTSQRAATDLTQKPVGDKKYPLMHEWMRWQKRQLALTNRWTI